MHKANIFELEKLNLSNIKRKEDSNYNSKNLYKIDCENINDNYNDENILKENNDISTIKKGLNNDNCDNNIIKNISFNSSSYNRLDEENNLKEKINIPNNISPIIKNALHNNLQKLSCSLSKSDFSYSLNIKNSNNFNNININMDSNKNSNKNKELVNNLNKENKSTSKQNKTFRKINEIMSQTHERPKNFLEINEKRLLQKK